MYIIGEYTHAPIVYLFSSHKDSVFILQSEGQETVAFWNVSYPAHTYAPGPYEVEVIVDKSTIVFWPISSQRINFNITGIELIIIVYNIHDIPLPLLLYQSLTQPGCQGAMAHR